VTFTITHRVDAVNIGTFYSFLMNGILIATADKLVFPKLVHNFKVNK